MPRVSITIPGKNPQPYRFNLDHKKVTIGRSKDSDIVIDEPSVSSLHATMERVEGGYILRDRGSTNGITLDDELMDIIDLRNGDDVKVGDASFDYTLSDEEQDKLDDEEFKSHERPKGAAPTSTDTESEEDEEEEEKPKPKKKKSTKQPAPTVASGSSPSSPPPLMVGSSQSGGGFFSSMGVIILGALAFCLGVKKTYEDTEEEKGRENVSLIQDIKKGKPIIKDEDGQQ